MNTTDDTRGRTRHTTKGPSQRRARRVGSVVGCGGTGCIRLVITPGVDYIIHGRARKHVVGGRNLYTKKELHHSIIIVKLSKHQTHNKLASDFHAFNFMNRIAALSSA